jgi:miniconductance mechanosensitive channel
MISFIRDFILDLLVSINVGENTAQYFTELLMLIAFLLILWFVDFLIRKFVYKIVQLSVKKTKTEWDDILLENNFFKRIVHLLPAFLLQLLIQPTFVKLSFMTAFLLAAIKIYIIIMITLALVSVVRAANIIYERKHLRSGKSLKTYSQIVQIFIFIISAILIISITFSKQPSALIGGLGAFTAVLMLVFKDSILGFVGGIQLSANDMVQIGDWIAMPSKGADGNVIEISLTTVKVQNWDKTITTIPTYDLVQNSFQNWKGMEKSGGRRIMRNILINTQSIKFLDEELFGKLSKIHVLRDYLSNKQNEITKYNKEHNVDESVKVNGRRQTNIGAFRAYLTEYLKANPNINHDMIYMVRQLEATEKGVPLQIYAFSKIQSWVEYEGIQSDIMDHVLAIIDEFELSLFQNPSGKDFRKLIN